MAWVHRASIWGLTGALLVIGPAQGAVIYLDVAELTAGAQQIVIGDVVGLTSFWNDDHTLIKTRVVVQVDQYLLGQGNGTEVLEMSGGTVGDLTLRVSVLPTFEIGDHVLLFLDSSEIRLVGCFQGAYLTDGRLAARMGPACVRIIPESVQPLSELLTEIRRALPAGTTMPAIPPYAGSFQLPAAERYALCGADWSYKPSPMGENYVINPNCVDSSAGNADSQRTQIQNGPAAWNNAGADFVFTYGGDSTQTAVSYNNVNLVYFDTTPPDGGGYVAATYYWASGGNMLECDLVFNDQSYTWWNGSGSCGGDKMDIWNISTHEFGHWLCLGDLYGGGDTEKTMYGYVAYCETKKRTLHTDDINGIIAIYGTAQPPDTTPPTPDPMSFATPPYPAGATSISMVATTATDSQSPPVQYQFVFVSGGSGGTSSGWISSTNYTDSGLTANTSYTYKVNARDSASTPNETAFSPDASTVTYIQTPTGVSFGPVSESSIVLQATGTFTNLAVGMSGIYFDSTTPGGDGGINEWIQVTADTATGLSPNTQYAFRAKARNQNAVETGYCTTASKYTLANVPGAPTLSNVTSSTMDLDVNPNGNPATTEFAVRCASTVDPTWNGMYVDASGNPNATAVWQTDSTWGAITIQALDPNTQYCFDVKARNGELVETAFSGQSCAQTSGSPIVPGDMNCDGTVGFADINPFVLALTNLPAWQAAYPGCPLLNGDINQDGTFGFADINPFVACMTSGHCP